MADDRKDAVRSQYEAYPYPPRDPADEKRRLVTGSPSHLDEVDHHVFAGRLQDRLRDRGGLRVLVAGGGTGDGAIMLAQQLAERSPASEVLYVDVSAASRRVARERARVRGLRNIRFERLSIADLSAGEVGRFDYIDCCGVLHHLNDPAAGLAVLAELLVADGGIGLMVYGELGRIGVYHMQEMIRLVAGDEGDDIRLDFARRLLSQLPATNWLRRNPFVRDHLEQGDAGLYDLLLHAKDRAYRVPEVAELAEAAGLRIIAFIDPAFYEPASYLGDSGLVEALDGLPWLERCRFAELLAGNMRKHVFYAVKSANPVTPPDPTDRLVVPVLRDLDGAALAQQCRPGIAITANRDGVSLQRPLPDLAGPILGRIDGRRTLAEIHADLSRAERGLEWDAFAGQFKALSAALNGIGKLYLSYRQR